MVKERERTMDKERKITIFNDWKITIVMERERKKTMV